MARRGENIRKRSDGRWEGRYLIYINGSKKYRSVYAPSYNEVKQKLFNSKKESEITLLSLKEQTAPLNGSADMSLDKIGQLWLIYIKDNRKYSTYRKYENTLSIVKKADFSVLMRENKRYAKAGVSTKFVEAMSLAVPSICTAVGGTDAFVRDGVDGFLIKDNSVYEILGKLELIVNMDSSEILQMKLNALNKAKHVFSEDQYFEVTKLFLKGKVFDGQQ